MARNQTLLSILNAVRGEARLSLNPAHNISNRDAQVGLIQREQERLWAAYEWPHLMVYRYIPLEEGRRYYNTYDAVTEEGLEKQDLSFERLTEISYFDGGMWRPVTFGIHDRQRFHHDSHAGQRSWPPRRWDRAEEDRIEIWPIPDEAGNFVAPDFNMQGVIRLKGVRNLRRFVDDSDRADLDDRLISLFCAAKLLTEAKAADAQMALDAARLHYDSLTRQQTKTNSFGLFNRGRIHDEDLCRHPYPYVTHYRRPE